MVDLGIAAGKRAWVGPVTCLLAVAWMIAHATQAPASSLLAPAVGAADSATVGTRVADPQTPSAALFENPAGLIGFDTFTHGGGLGLGFGEGRVEASMPAGFSETEHTIMAIPDFGASIPYRERWRFALGMYGSTGSRFDFGPDAATGVPSFFSEMIVLAVPLATAYRLSDHVSIGAEVQPMFGQLRTHFPLGGLEFRYKINGPGVQGMVGTTVRLNEQWAFGLGARLPGMIWMDGSMPVPGQGRQHVGCDLRMPAQVFLGMTWRGLPRLALSAGARFTDSSSFGESKIKYEFTPQADSGFVPDSEDEWKFGLAGEYAIRDETRLHLGVSWATHIVGAKGVNPLVFDDDDTKIGTGVRHDFGQWVVDLMVGYALPTKRHIPSTAALVFPGAYSMEGVIVMLGVMHH